MSEITRERIARDYAHRVAKNAKDCPVCCGSGKTTDSGYGEEVVYTVEGIGNVYRCLGCAVWEAPETNGTTVGDIVRFTGEGDRVLEYGWKGTVMEVSRGEVKEYRVNWNELAGGEVWVKGWDVVKDGEEWEEFNRDLENVLTGRDRGTDPGLICRFVHSVMNESPSLWGFSPVDLILDNFDVTIDEAREIARSDDRIRDLMESQSNALKMEKELYRVVLVVERVKGDRETVERHPLVLADGYDEMREAVLFYREVSIPHWMVREV